MDTLLKNVHDVKKQTSCKTGGDGVAVCDT